MYPNPITLVRDMPGHRVPQKQSIQEVSNKFMGKPKEEYQNSFEFRKERSSLFMIKLNSKHLLLKFEKFKKKPTVQDIARCLTKS